MCYEGFRTRKGLADFAYRLVAAKKPVILKGTNTGPILSRDGPSIPGTNKRVERRSAVFWRLNPDGLIGEEHFYFDTAGLFGQ
jgi:hypothetical protein